MVKKRISLAIPEQAGRRFMLAYRFLNVHGHELLSVALDSIGIPTLSGKYVIREEAQRRIRQHLDMVEKSGIDEGMSDYFKRSKGNDNK